MIINKILIICGSNPVILNNIEILEICGFYNFLCETTVRDSFVNLGRSTLKDICGDNGTKRNRETKGGTKKHDAIL